MDTALQPTTWCKGVGRQVGGQGTWSHPVFLCNNITVQRGLFACACYRVIQILIDLLILCLHAYFLCAPKCTISSHTLCLCIQGPHSCKLVYALVMSYDSRSTQYTGGFINNYWSRNSCPKSSHNPFLTAVDQLATVAMQQLLYLITENPFPAHRFCPELGEGRRAVPQFCQGNLSRSTGHQRQAPAGWEYHHCESWWEHINLPLLNHSCLQIRPMTSFPIKCHLQSHEITSGHVTLLSDMEGTSSSNRLPYTSVILLSLTCRQEELQTRQVEIELTFTLISLLIITVYSAMPYRILWNCYELFKVDIVVCGPLRGFLSTFCLSVWLIALMLHIGKSTWMASGPWSRPHCPLSL